MSKLYKILGGEGESCDGGNFAWSLPKDGKPGDWHRIPDHIRVETCYRGLHVTRDPACWWKPGRMVFEVEVAGDAGEFHEDKQKIAYREVRLMRRVAAEDVVRESGAKLLRGALTEADVWSGSGSGYGYGYGSGSGYGYGYGAGYGYGSGSGSGDGYGYGYGYGDGSGDGDGYGALADIVQQ